MNLDTNQDSNFGLLGKSIFELLPMGIVIFDRDLKIIEANPQAAKLIKLADYIDKSLAQGTGSGDTQGRNWTKQLKSALSTGKTRIFDSVNYTLSKGVKTKVLRIICIPMLARDDTSIKDAVAINHRGQAVLPDGIDKASQRAKKPAAGIIIEDITEKADIRKNLANAERLATVGKLASKVAHELNNPIDGILRYINLALRIIKQENLEKPKEYLDNCRQGLMRMVQIVSELLEFSRNARPSFEYIRIEQIIEDAIKAMDKRAETSNTRIFRNHAGGIPQIKNGDLFQVFCNLIKNALDAMPDGGELNISTRMASDNTIVVEFRDTGSGFAPENLEAIFEPFFTTKDKGKGTGLGLAICKDIIERHHGRIIAENAPQGGGIFTVYLPVADNQ